MEGVNPETGNPWTQRERMFRFWEEAYLHPGWSPQQVCEELGLSRHTVAWWRKERSEMWEIVRREALSYVLINDTTRKAMYGLELAITKGNPMAIIPVLQNAGVLNKEGMGIPVSFMPEIPRVAGTSENRQTAENTPES